jgi:hypothetical protein
MISEKEHWEDCACTSIRHPHISVQKLLNRFLLNVIFVILIKKLLGKFYFRSNQLNPTSEEES